MFGMAGFKQGLPGVSNDDVLILLEDVAPFDTFMLGSTAGAVDVFVSLDGTNFYGPVSLSDFGAVTSDPVIVTAAGRLYGLRGKFRKLRVMQNGATAVANLFMSYGTMN